VLYESWHPPITILSTLPSAGAAPSGADARWQRFSIIATLRRIPLIGIVGRTSAIVDFA
jgi:multidrug efflux pump subunit AcrB